MRMSKSVIFAAIAATLALSAAPASAQGFFDIFNFGRRSAPAPQVQPYAPFGGDESAPVERATPGATYATYCVRLCDGRFFPIQRNAGNAAETCSSFCPAAKTAVYSGAGIEHAVSTSGKRYADLDNAFTYRDKVVDNCTCNGRTAYGLARVDATRDQTLRAGDIVATANGMATYNGSGRGVAQFTPIDKSKVSSEMRSRLANMRIQPELNGEDRAATETTGAPAVSEKPAKQSQR